MGKNKSYFLSDAHLGSRYKGDDHREAKLAEFCASIEESAETLYLLGDIFDFWFEYRHAIPSGHFQALCALNRLRSRGTAIVYIGGNHDFWIGRFLSEKIGMEVHFTPLVRNVAGQRILLSHGDGAVSEEWFYPLFKKLLRNNLNRRLYRLLHPDIGLPFAKFIASLSRRHVEATLNPEKVAAKYREAAREILRREPVDAVVMGHTHFADLQTIDGKTYVNTGNWIKEFNYVVLEDGKFSLRTFH